MTLIKKSPVNTPESRKHKLKRLHNALLHFRLDMKNLFNLLTNQNNNQRVGSFLAFAAFIMLLFIHNPIDGYTLTFENDYGVAYGHAIPMDNPFSDCYAWAIIIADQTTPDQLRAANRGRMEQAGCFGKHLLPFGEWSSNSPLVSWLGPVSHFMWTAFVICVLYLAWLFAFRSREAER